MVSLCFSCKNNEADTGMFSIETAIVLDKGCKPINENVSRELNSYRNSEPLPIVDKGMVDPAYFLSFFQENQDSFMLMGYQPYILEIFPDYAIDFKLNYTPEIVGFAEIDSEPLIVYDLGNKLGAQIYDSNCLNSEIPENYFLEPDNFLTHIGPLRLYEITDDNLNFLKEVPKMILK